MPARHSCINAVALGATALLSFAAGTAAAVPACTANGIIIEVFPSAGALTPIAGVVPALVNPSAYKVVLYVQDAYGINWWTKPLASSFATLNDAGEFFFYNWASNPATDTLLTAFALFVIPWATPVASVLGGPLPTYAGVGLIATSVYPAGISCNSGALTSNLTVTTFPGDGGTAFTDPISGIVSGLPGGNPAAFEIALYLQAPLTVWWSKSFPGIAYPINEDGSFSIAGWASAPVTDAAFVAFELYIVPVGTTIPAVLGSALPATLLPAANLVATIPRGVPLGTMYGGVLSSPTRRVLNVVNDEASPPAATPAGAGASPLLNILSLSACAALLVGGFTAWAAARRQRKQATAAAAPLTTAGAIFTAVHVAGSK